MVQMAPFIQGALPMSARCKSRGRPSSRVAVLVGEHGGWFQQQLWVPQDVSLLLMASSIVYTPVFLVLAFSPRCTTYISFSLPVFYV